MTASSSPQGTAWQRWFARDTSSTPLIPEVDGLRFLAIFSVILYHLSGFYLIKTGQPRDMLGRLLAKGYFGVPLFFVISGFVIALPFARARFAEGRPPSLRAYYLRRLTRLEPPYVLNLLAMTLALWTAKGLAPTVLMPHLAASLSYSHLLIFGKESSINGVTWSLEVEWQFYLLAPVLVTLFRIPSATLRQGFTALIMTAWSLGVTMASSANPRLVVSFLSYGPYFLAGLLLADVYVSRWKEAPKSSRGWDVVATGCWLAVVALLFGPHLGTALLPLVVLGAYLGALRGIFWRWLLSRPLLYLVGGMCYTIYLYHFLFISLIGNPILPLLARTGWSGGLGILALGIVVVPPTIGCCAALFLVAEKPFMRRGWPSLLLAKLRRRNRTLAPAGSWP